MLRAGLQPVLIAIAQVLAFYAANVGEFPPGAVVRSLACVSGAALVLWLLLLRPVGDARKAALVASAVAFLFWSSSSLLLRTGSGPLGLAAMLSLWCFALPALGLWIARTERGLRPLGWIVDAAAVAGVVVPLLTIVPAVLASLEPDRHGELPRTPGEAAVGLDRRPDVYLIVLDAYGRDDELAEHFGLERGLGAQLRERGFYVAAGSRTNYSTTPHSLASLLNFDLLQNLTPRVTEPLLGRLICRNRFARFLRGKGYRFVTYATGMTISECHNADEFVEPPTQLSLLGIELRPEPFERGLLSWTPLDGLLRWSEMLSPYTRHRQRVLYALADVARHARDPSPAFVFMHVISPHEPFVFGSTGEDVSPHREPFQFNRIFADPYEPREAGRVGPEYARRYRAQAVYLAGRVVDAVDGILRDSREPPIIIVQSDHGPYGFSPDVRQARFAILNAYFLPGGSAGSWLYPTISPVNSLRMVLNRYFGFRLPLRPDVSFRSDWLAPNIFVRVPRPPVADGGGGRGAAAEAARARP